MRLLRIVLAFLIASITVLQSKHKLCYSQQINADTCEVSSELEVAAMLLRFGKWFLIIAAIWMIFFV